VRRRSGLRDVPRVSRCMPRRAERRGLGGVRGCVSHGLFELGPIGSQCPACGGEADAGDLASSLLHQQCAPFDASLGGCDDCLRAHCCQVVENCLTPQCLGYENCVLACPTSPDDGGSVDAPPQDDGSSPGACEEACAHQYPDGRGGWAAFIGCYQVFCGSESACDEPLSSCSQCVISQCLSEYVDYVGSSDGFALAFCIDGCRPTDIACTTACYNEHPDALKTVSAVNQCALEHCPACQPP